MVIVAAKIRNFQSIEKADVEFQARPGGGGLTTIVGPSSTGKSAFLRALRLCVRNSSSVPVRAGAKHATVALTTDRGTVILERGPSLSTYRTVIDGYEMLYTKSSTSVPDDVTALLALKTGTPEMHFSFQFDKPYLISETGSTVTRVIGELSNANILAEALREGARRRQVARNLAEVRAGDVASVREKLSAYTDLKQQQTAVAEAREIFAEAQAATQKATATEALTEKWSALIVGLEQLKTSTPPDVTEELNEAEKIVAQYRALEKLLSEHEATSINLENADSLHAEMQQKSREVAAEYISTLEALGVCPTCGQATCEETAE